jgi:hypothetical protein
MVKPTSLFASDFMIVASVLTEACVSARQQPPVCSLSVLKPSLRSRKGLESFSKRRPFVSGMESDQASKAPIPKLFERWDYVVYVTLDHQFTVAAINVSRIDAFLEERHPTKTRTSHLVALSSKEVS